MPAWIIEMFGREELQKAFLSIVLLPLPFWIVAVLSKKWSVFRQLLDPIIVCGILALILPFLIWKFFSVDALPDIATDVTYRGAKSFVAHPLSFLYLLAAYMISNLFIGLTILERASKERMNVGLELSIAYLFGPIAISLFSFRLLISRRSLNG